MVEKKRSSQSRPAASGKKSEGRPPLFNQRQKLSRLKSLRQLVRLLENQADIPEEAIRLMLLFQYSADELTEAGISYETVRAVEKHYPFILREG